MNLALLVAAAFAATPPAPTEIRARVVDRPEAASALLFNLKQTEETTPEGLRLVAVHLNPDGSVAMREEVLVDKAGVPVLYLYEQKQLGEHGKVEVKDGKVRFSYHRPGDEETKSEDDWTPNYVTGPTLFRYVDQNWDKLVAGKELPIRIAVPEREGVYSFKLVPKVPKPGDEKVSIQLKGASMLVALAMDPVDLEFDAKTHRPLHAFGHAFPKRRKGDGWGDLVAETVFEK